jgi:hypothetical protein
MIFLSSCGGSDGKGTPGWRWVGSGQHPDYSRKSLPAGRGGFATRQTQAPAKGETLVKLGALEMYSARKKKNNNTKKNVEEKGEKVRRYQVHIFEENKLAEVIWKRRSELGD